MGGWRRREDPLPPGVPVNGDGPGQGGPTVETESPPRTDQGVWVAGRTPVGVVLLHDLGATPAGLRTIMQSLVGEGAWVAAPLLPGHGADPSRLSHHGVADWLAAADNAVIALRSKVPHVLLMGCGLGGALAVVTSARRSDQVAGLVTVSAPARTFSRRRLLYATYGRLVRRMSPLGPDVKRADAQEPLADWLPARAYTALAAAERMAWAAAPHVSCRSLVIQPREDHVVRPTDATALCDRLGTPTKELLWLERSFHQAWIDHDGALLTDHVTMVVLRLRESGALR